MAAATDSVAGAIDALRGGEAATAVCFLGGLGPVYARRLAALYGAASRAPAGTGLDGALAMARELP
jgi:hypothetical protein